MKYINGYIDYIFYDGILLCQYIKIKLLRPDDIFYISNDLEHYTMHDGCTYNSDDCAETLLQLWDVVKYFF